ncbi:hypothetical protein JL49_13360 [Pseudoalteromonas luteoviolacea]|uniref:hypothetical protein n=1 Tax=Pseudoalteromonas luteoviolacea TaxID=43657 RepID=UPI0007BC62E6|nr:hypothetical protein [Pseudoalteromonas luteoviolacea]KZX00079.1 hypothetical protein JL49_13360 [Pseudoalteromonas luteoviolacea]MBQ4836052.1 hypothetical protein [Pseudoalteromonas luteoviolacea]
MSDNKLINKPVDIAHIITTVTLLVASVNYLADFDKRISLNEQQIKDVKVQRVEDQSRIGKQLDTINEKLDKLIESK